MAYGIQVQRNGIMMNAVTNPTNVLAVITNGSGTVSYPAMTGWILEAWPTEILINGDKSRSTATVNGWSVTYSNVSDLRPLIITIRGV
ncbi:hypothetical protein AXK76_22490 [Salmonella enterica subsp. enterica]|nr:hypothetical protein [Salmonella enterica subsp. enterica]EBP9904533.1 hypothetical protein [Salmonella enterica subsp. enterica]ELI7044648.1 hypothetical protein [Salmonella enterica]